METTRTARARRAIVTGIAALALAGLGLAGAGQASAATSGSDEAETEYEWSIDLDCTICHAKQAESLGVLEAEANDEAEADEKADASEADAAAGAEEAEAEAADADDEAIRDFAAQHVQDFGLTCVTCHEDSPELAKAHNKLNSGKESKRLKKTKVTSEVCLGCHVQEDLADATADFEGIVDEKGTVVNPHALPENDSHADITCLTCHKVHDTEDSVADNAMSACLGCHHAGVFECGTCH